MSVVVVVVVVGAVDELQVALGRLTCLGACGGDIGTSGTPFSVYHDGHAG